MFGAGHVAQALVRCLLEMECQVVCIDPRPDWLDQSAAVRQAHARCKPTTCRHTSRKLSDDDFVVCMTMGHHTDRPILEEIFRQGRQPAYLGVIGSEAKRKVLVRELTEAGIAPASRRAIPLPDRLAARHRTSRAKSPSASPPS